MSKNQLSTADNNKKQQARKIDANLQCFLREYLSPAIKQASQNVCAQPSSLSDDKLNELLKEATKKYGNNKGAGVAGITAIGIAVMPLPIAVFVGVLAFAAMMFYPPVIGYYTAFVNLLGSITIDPTVTLAVSGAVLAAMALAVLFTYIGVRVNAEKRVNRAIPNLSALRKLIPEEKQKSQVAGKVVTGVRVDEEAGAQGDESDNENSCN